MRAFMKKIDRFVAEHPNFGISRLILYVIIGNAVVWLFCKMDTTSALAYELAFNPAAFCRGHIWQLLTYVLVPDASGPIVLVIELYFYYFIGTSLEREWGTAYFTIYYLMGVILTAVYALIAYWLTGITNLYITATYIHFSMFLAFATLWPEQRVLFMYFIPIKVKWLGIADAVFMALEVIGSLISGDFVLAFLPIIAVLNYLLFCGDWLLEFVSPGRAQQKAKTIKFKASNRVAAKKAASAAYTRKCAVCGRTDTEYPNLEFRYCSRCVGYHCFCIDHINSHVHFTQE